MKASKPKSKLMRLWNWGRLCLGLVGLGIVVYSVSEEEALLDTFLEVDMGLIFIAFLLTVFSTVLKTWRWWLVLRHSQINLSFQRLFGTYLVGTFFSQFMPGSSMGGDAMRMVETSVDTGRAVTSVSSVLVERVIGLTTVIVSASIILLVSPNHELDGSAVGIVLHLLAVLGVAGIVILRMGWFVKPTISILERLKLHVIAGKIETMSQALRGQLGEGRLLVEMIALSFLANAATMTASYIALTALGNHASFISFIPLIALIVAIEVIPISPGALGLREAAYVAFLTGFLDVPRAVALSTALLVRAISLALGVVGGVVFVARALDQSSEKSASPSAPSS